MRRLTEIGEGSGDIQMIQLEDSGYIYSMMKKEHRMDVVRRYSELICPTVWQNWYLRISFRFPI
jgi:hypothetical protein